jgi:hypothetical protein
MSLLSISKKIRKMVLIQILKILQDEYKAKIKSLIILLQSLAWDSLLILFLAIWILGIISIILPIMISILIL